MTQSRFQPFIVRLSRFQRLRIRLRDLFRDIVHRLKYPNAVTHNVSTTEEFLDAMSKAKAGDVVKVHPGSYRR